MVDEDPDRVARRADRRGRPAITGGGERQRAARRVDVAVDRRRPVTDLEGGVASTDDKDLLWGFVRRYAPDTSPESHPELDALIGHALAYFRDFVAGSLRRRPPDEREAAALRQLDSNLAEMEGAEAEAIQHMVFEVGKAHGFENLRDWFKALYETLLGTSQGPRMGSFIALYGIANTRKLIAEALAL